MINVVSSPTSTLLDAVSAATFRDVLAALPENAVVIVPTSAHRRLVLRTWAADQRGRDVPTIQTMAAFVGGLAKRTLSVDHAHIDDVEADVLLTLAMTDAGEQFRPARLSISTIVRSILHLLVRADWDVGIWFMPHVDAFNRSTEIVPWLVSHGWEPVHADEVVNDPHIVLRSWPTMRDEVRRTFAAVKELLQNGMSHANMAIVLPTSGRYDHLVHDVALTAGVPLQFDHHEPLAEHRTSTAIYAACQIVVGGWQRADVERLLLSGQVRTDHDVGRLSEMASQFRINGGSGPADWLKRLEDARDRLAATMQVEDDKRIRIGLVQLGKARIACGWLQQLLAPPGDTLRAADFVQWVRTSVVTGLGLEPLTEIESTLDRYVAMADRHGLQMARFSDHVERWWSIVHGTTQQEQNAPRSGVAVYRASEIRMRSLAAVFVLGVIDGEMPTRKGEPIDETLMEGLRAKIDRENYSDVLQSVQDGGVLVLSRPTTIDQDPTLTSPFFREVSEHENTTQINEPCSIEALDARDVVLLLDRLDDRAYRSGTALDIQHRQAGLEASALSDSARATLDERLGQPMNPSRLDVAADCPYAFYAKRILGLDESVDGDELLTPLERGTLMHGVAHAFYDRVRNGSVVNFTSIDDVRSAFADLTTKSVEQWLPVLHEVFTEQRAKFPGGYLYDEAEQRAFADTDSRPGLLRRWLGMEYALQLESPFRPILFELDVETDIVIGDAGAVPIRVRIDRIDAAIVQGAVHVVVIDYKTTDKSVPKMFDVVSGQRTQMPLYIEAVKTWFGERNINVHVVGSAYHTFGRSVRDVANPVRKMSLMESGTDVGKLRRGEGKYPFSNEPMEDQLTHIASAIAPVVMGIREARFPVIPTEKACRYCGLTEVCRIDEWGPYIEPNATTDLKQ